MGIVTPKQAKFCFRWAMKSLEWCVNDVSNDSLTSLLLVLNEFIPCYIVVFNVLQKEFVFLGIYSNILVIWSSLLIRGMIEINRGAWKIPQTDHHGSCVKMNIRDLTVWVGGNGGEKSRSRSFAWFINVVF